MGEYVNGLQHGFVMHQTHTAQAQNIGDFMGVGKHGRGAMCNYGAGKFGRGQHARFDVHMCVTQTRDHVTPVGLDHLRVRPNAMGCICSAIRETAILDCDIVIFQNLAGLDINPFPASDYSVGSHAPNRNSD